MRICLDCLKDKDENEFRENRTRCRKCDLERVNRRALELKRKLVDQLGGKCSICGYNRNLAALTFHHSGHKEFRLAMRVLATYSEERIMAEVSKCVLLCSNCHAETHHPHLTLT